MASYGIILALLNLLTGLISVIFVIMLANLVFLLSRDWD